MKPRSQPLTTSRRFAGYAIAVAGLIGLFVGSTARAEQQITLTPEQPFVDLPLEIGDLDVIAHSDAVCGNHPVDPYLQIRLGEQVLAADDDGAHSYEDCVSSRMRFSVPADGYVLRVMSCCGRNYGPIRLEFLQSGVSVPTSEPSTTVEETTTTLEEQTTTTEESTTTTDATTTTVLETTTTTEAVTTTLWTTTSGVTTTLQTTTTTTQPVPTTASAVPTVAPTTAPSIASSVPSTTTTSSTVPVTEPATTTTSSSSSTVVEPTTTTSAPVTTDAIASPAEKRLGAKAKYRMKLPFVSLDIEVSPEQRQTVIVVNVVQTVLGSAVASSASTSRKRR